MMKKSLKSIKKINKFANIITKRGYAFDVVKRENENLLYIRQDGKEICCWRDIKARNTETVGTYNFVATTSVQEFTPSPSYDPFIVNPRETSRTLYHGNVNGDKPQNTSVIRSTDVYPLAVSAQEYLELNDTRYERNKFYHIETPYIPDYESVRRISDEAHIPFRPWSLGYIPQTFEDERYISEPAQEVGNCEPLRAVVLNSQFTPGEVSSIKVLSAFGFYDNTVKSQITNKFRWIAVAIRSDDPLAAQTNDLDDLQNNFPWFMAGFRMYQTFYPSFSVVERDRQNILTKLLSSKEFSYIGNAFPNARRYTHNLTGSIYSKRDSDLKNEWWVLGQPQFTEEALTIVEKSHKKFKLRNHEYY